MTTTGTWYPPPGLTEQQYDPAAGEGQFLSNSLFQSMTLPNDYARCSGWGDSPDEWLDECHDCQRRTAPGGERNMQPPQIITFFCEYYIPPDRPEDQRLRDLARRQGVGV